MRAWLFFCASLSILLAACDQGGHEGDVTGLHPDGGTMGREGGIGCAAIPGGCIMGGGDAGPDGALDAGIDDGAVDDGATTDAGPQPMCQVPPAGNTLTVHGSDGTTPAFTVRHVWAGWAPLACSSPHLTLALTDADTCVDAAGQQLDIGFFTTGPMAPMTTSYMLGTGTSAIAIDYLPPAMGTAPSDFGCVQSGGMITFDSLSWPPLAGSNHVSGTLSATLYPCGSATMTPTWSIDGNFDVPIDTPQPTCP